MQVMKYGPLPLPMASIYTSRNPGLAACTDTRLARMLMSDYEVTLVNDNSAYTCQNSPPPPLSHEGVRIG